MRKAEITAFLSMVFVLLVSFVLGILEISFIQTSKNLSRLSADRAVFSVFGEYHEKLLSDYHIFAIEGSYGTGEFSEEKLTERMQYYGTGDMKYDVTGIQYLTDRQGQPFREQVLQYMEEKYGISIIRDFTGLTTEWKEQAVLGKEMEEKEKGILEEADSLMENAQIPEKTEENGGSDISETDGENTEQGNPFTCIEQIEKSGILYVVMPKDMELSGKKVDLGSQASNRSLNTGRGNFPVRQGTDGLEEKLLFNEYILNNLSNAVSDPAAQSSEGVGITSENNDRSLSYETEYVLEGKASDKENLESFLMKLLLVRMALNYVYLMGDSEKQSEAAAFAAAVTTVLLIPEAAGALKQLVLLAWAAGESIVDIRTLLSGKKAALVKSSDTWQLPLSSLLTLGSSNEQIGGEDVPGGVEYKDYLRIFLFLENPDDVNMRLLDRIEENIKTEYGMDYFKADQCVTKLEADSTSEILGGITYEFPVYFGYE